MKRPPVVRDLAFVNPYVLARYLLALRDHRAMGNDTVTHETKRTEERGDYLQSTGASKNGRLSIHIPTDDRGRVGAVDAISDLWRWFVPPKGASKERKAEIKAAGRKFFATWHECAERHGLHTIDWDGPHVQCVPARPAAQNAYRAMTAKARGEFLAKTYPLSDEGAAILAEHGFAID